MDEDKPTLTDTDIYAIEEAIKRGTLRATYIVAFWLCLGVIAANLMEKII